MEEALHDMALFRDFAGLGNWNEPVPDETTILRFRRVLEKHKLAPKILETINDLLRNKGLMLRAGTVVDATLIAAPSSTKNAAGKRDPEMKQSKKDYQEVDKRPDTKLDTKWDIAMRPGMHRALDKSPSASQLIDELEKFKASIRAKVEQQVGHVKVRYRSACEEYGATPYRARVVQPVDGAPPIGWSAGMSATAVSENCRIGGLQAPKLAVARPEMAQIASRRCGQLHRTPLACALRRASIVDSPMENVTLHM